MADTRKTFNTIEIEELPTNLTCDFARMVELMHEQSAICIVETKKIKDSMVRAIMRYREKLTGDQRNGHFTLALEPKEKVGEYGAKYMVERWAIALRNGAEDDQNPLPEIFPTDWIAQNTTSTYGRWKKAAELLDRDGETTCKNAEEARKISVAYRNYYNDSTMKIAKEVTQTEEGEALRLYLVQKKKAAGKKKRTKAKAN